MAQALSNLPIGAKIKFGKHQVGNETPWDIVWLVVAKSHVGYPSNSVTLLAEKCVDALSYDVREPNNTDSGRTQDGNNRYSISNIDQWLNSPNSQWYVSRHAADTPPSADYVAYFSETPYDNRSGFLYNFTSVERNAILNTTIRNVLHPTDGGGYEDVTRKIFLPSRTETTGQSQGGTLEGSRWVWFANNTDLKCYMFEQARINSINPRKPTSSNETIQWWTRTASHELSGRALFYSTSGEFNTHSVMNGYGIRPAMNLSSTLKISDTTDSEGCYTAVWNSAPSAPSILNVPNTIYGGKSNPISWSTVNDPDGDALTYTLECSVNGGAYTQLYRGTSTVYAHIVPFGTTSVQYRVKATDPSNENSAYNTSTSRTVVNNNAPVISGSDSNLGVKSEGFTGTYTVTDANNNSVTVTESIDGVQIRSLVATLGATITYGITGNTWLTLPNGSHTLTIRATDGIDSTVRTYTFTKLVNSFSIRNSTPWSSNTMPSRIMLVITRNLPSEATFKVEVCNNGYDASPKWEDATDAVKSGLIHVFANKTKTASNWGVVVRVTVNRNGATGACYVSAIGGNFE